MTTICWDGKTLAGDTQTTLHKGWMQKVFRIDDRRLFGGSGHIQNIYAVKAWLEGGEKPAFGDNEAFHGILIEDGKPFTLESRLIAVPHNRPFHAVGSGRDYAMAAMHLGKSAAEAVKVAMEFDDGTGGDIMQVCIEAAKPRAILSAA